MRRQFPIAIKRAVIKVGSSVLASHKQGLDRRRLKRIVDQVSTLTDAGIEVLLVSSGAIASGMSVLHMSCRPGKLSCLQATAAIGQNLLMQTYSDLFRKNAKLCAQVLLTWEDFNERKRYINAKNTLLQLLEYDVIPIINENDTVSIEEIKFGDNDRLSALVANLAEAQLLIILSDVEGVYKGKGDQKYVIPIIEEINSEIERISGGTDKKNISIGGMLSKLDAARIAMDSGIPCLIADGKTPDILLKILEGKQIGTLFIPKSIRLEAKKRWIAHSAKSRGRIYVDDGAKQALVKSGKSLLCPGIFNTEGKFSAGDIVSVVDSKGQEFAKGLTNYSSQELIKARGCKLDREVIHRNSLVIMNKD
jgi:glutamate 5-kinase